MRTIKEFIRDFDDKPYGCMVATVVEQNGLEFVSIGVSLCHVHDKDKWSKKLGTEIAMGRAEVINTKMRLPMHGPSVNDDSYVYYLYNEEQLAEFVKRSRAYFQDKPIILPNIEWF